jgi:DNA-binding transcriptional LysR family regulator
MAERRYLERLPRYLSMRQMRMLEAVAEQGSVLKASRELRVAQPSVSRTLGELETALGVKLFERSARGMTPTVFGAALLRRVKTIFGELRDAEEDLRSLKEGWHGHVRLGCTRLFSAGVLPRLLSAMMRTRPGLNFSVVEGNTESLFRALRDRDLDIVLGRLPGQGSREDDLEYERLFQEHLLLITCAGHALAQRRRIPLEETLGEPWGLPMRTSMLYRVIEQTFAGLDHPLPPLHVQADSVELMFALVEAGDVITLMPASILTEKARRYRLKVIAPAQTVDYGPLGYITLRGRQPTPAMNLLTSFLRVEMGAALGKTGLATQAPRGRRVTLPA